MSVSRRFQYKYNPGTVATAASSGITISDLTRSLVSNVIEVFNPYDNSYITKLTVRAFSTTTTNAAKAFGQKLYDFPQGFIVPHWGVIQLSSTTGAATAATAGEIGLGTVIGSGANATLGAVGATSEDFMEGTTISNHVAATALASNKANYGVRFGTQGATAPAIVDGTSTAADMFFNMASTFDSTDGITINSLTVTFKWQLLLDV